MRILIAPDSFKECMTAVEAANAIARGVKRSLGDSVEIDLCPVADGGEGTLQVIAQSIPCTLHETTVTGPLGDPVKAAWLMSDNNCIAIIESAQAIGLHLVPPAQRDPTRTTTYGVGQLILAALNAGATRVIVSIGGTATIDGGCGMAQALGVWFGDMVSEPIRGGELQQIDRVDRGEVDGRIVNTKFLVLCDVENELLGEKGAAVVFGPQKGATATQIQSLEAGLTHLASMIPDASPKFHMTGAAGGLAYGLDAFCRAPLVHGIFYILQIIRFDDRVRGCDLVITGEGRFDSQSLEGKACAGVAACAKKHGVPTLLLAGSIQSPPLEGGDKGVGTHYFIGSHSIVGDLGILPADAIRRGQELLEQLTTQTAPKYLNP